MAYTWSWCWRQPLVGTKTLRLSCDLLFRYFNTYFIEVMDRNVPIKRCVPETCHRQITTFGPDRNQYSLVFLSARWTKKNKLRNVEWKVSRGRLRMSISCLRMSIYLWGMLEELFTCGEKLMTTLEQLKTDQERRPQQDFLSRRGYQENTKIMDYVRTSWIAFRLWLTWLSRKSAISLGMLQPDTMIIQWVRTTWIAFLFHYTLETLQ